MMQVSQVMTRGVRTRPVRSLGGQRRDGRRSDCQDVGQTGAAMSRDPLSARTLRRRAAAGAVLPRVLVVAVALALVAGFALLNWQQLAVAVPVSLGVVTVDAPLGLIMLVLLAALALVFIAWALTLQGSMLLEGRRHARELQAQRELADRAEASRFTELRQHLDAELQRLTGRDDESRAALAARFDAVAAELRTAQEQAANSMAAYLGEIEDRLGRMPLLPPDVPRGH